MLVSWLRQGNLYLSMLEYLEAREKSLRFRELEVRLAVTNWWTYEMIRSDESWFTDFMSLRLCSPLGFSCPPIHSETPISKTLIFCFPGSILKEIHVSCSSLSDGSCQCHVHTIRPNTSISKYILSDLSIPTCVSKYFPTDLLHT